MLCECIKLSELQQAFMYMLSECNIAFTQKLLNIENKLGASNSVASNGVLFSAAQGLVLTGK